MKENIFKKCTILHFLKKFQNSLTCPCHCVRNRLLDIDNEVEFGFEREPLKQTTTIETTVVLETDFVFESAFGNDKEAGR